MFVPYLNIQGGPRPSLPPAADAHSYLHYHELRKSLLILRIPFFDRAFIITPLFSEQFYSKNFVFQNNFFCC